MRTKLRIAFNQEESRYLETVLNLMRRVNPTLNLEEFARKCVLSKMGEFLAELEKQIKAREDKEEEVVS